MQKNNICPASRLECFVFSLACMIGTVLLAALLWFSPDIIKFLLNQ